MDKHAWWKWLILGVAVAFSLALVVPPSKKIQLGLDLKGGTSFTVKIDEDVLRSDLKSRGEFPTEEALNAEVRRVLADAQDRALEVLRNRVDRLGLAEPILYPGRDNRIIIQLPGVDDAKREQAEQSIRSVAFLEFRMVYEKSDELGNQLFEKNLFPEGYHIVHIGNESYYTPDRSFTGDRGSPEYRDRLSRFHIPDASYEFMLEKEEAEGQTVYKPVFVRRRRDLSGESLKRAGVEYGPMNQPQVQLEFDAKGAKKFANLTADFAPGGPRNPNPNEYRKLAIILDGTLYSAPVIREAIYGGRAQITGHFTPAEATMLANILSAGSLPAPVRIVEKRFVAPTLGADSIRSGVRAAVVGSIAVVLFMLIYYMLAGLVADIALALNIIMLPLGMVATAGFMGIFASDTGGGGPLKLPVLTLPGIAGIVLTIGMAVDANVLIYERIREELRTGKRLWSAILAGYDRAFITIIDSNMTTIIAGVILFVVGSGPIRGFAVTLNAGLIINLFTAVTVTKLIFGLLVSRFNVQQIKMLHVIKDTKIDFVGVRRLAVGISVAVILVSWGLMIQRGIVKPSRVFGVDFTGGTAITFTFQQRLPIEEVRSTLDQAGVTDAQIQYQKEMDGSKEYLQVKTASDMIGDKASPEIVKDALKTKHPEAGYAVNQEDLVRGQIGADLARRSSWALGLALAAMMVYLGFRFEMGFAFGAFIALFHDVLVTAGLYSLFGRQMNMPIIAALLTIIGYSVNDTIVIFDRIRENLRLYRTQSFVEVCNLSINQCLGRTILTTATVFMTVVVMLVLGGGEINDFAFAMFIGVITGTYSTVYIATPFVLAWHRGRRPEMSSAPAK